MREEQILEAGRRLIQAAERLRTTKAQDVKTLKHELAEVAGDLESAGEALTKAIGER
jgi:hypothetical protein